MIVALTGGIGCGKSTALNIFSELGWQVFDADQVCHDIYESDVIFLRSLFEERWGAGAVGADNNCIDRKRVADIVFSDKNELAWLNEVFHPLIWKRVQSEVAKGCDIMFDVPLLYEVNWDKGFDAVIAVWAPDDQQRERLLGRGMTIEEIKQRIGNQISSDKKLEMADFGLINNSDEENLKEQCIKLNNQLRTM